MVGFESVGTRWNKQSRQTDLITIEVKFNFHKYSKLFLDKTLAQEGHIMNDDFGAFETFLS